MMAFATYLLMNEQKFLRQQLDEIFGMCFGGRYCIVLMAAFSIFTGLMYNEFFSMPMTLFGGTRMRVRDIGRNGGRCLALYCHGLDSQDGGGGVPGELVGSHLPSATATSFSMPSVCLCSLHIRPCCW